MKKTKFQKELEEFILKNNFPQWNENINIEKISNGYNIQGMIGCLNELVNEYFCYFDYNHIRVLGKRK